MAKDVRSILLGRIASGIYKLGSRLPSIRVLAAELGVNRNTVGKVYLDLRREGLVRSRRGEGAFVTHAPLGHLGAAEDQIRELLRNAFSYTTLAGVSSGRLRQLVDHELQAIGRREIPIAFVECNPYEAKEIAQRMQQVLGQRVVPLVLDELPPSARLLRDFPIISTTFFHFSELQEKVKDKGSRIIGLQHSPSTESILDIARLKRQTQIGVVASNDRTLKILLRLVETYHDSVVGSCLTEDIGKVRELAQRVEVLVVHPLAKRSIPGDIATSLIEVTFQIEPQSLDYLRQQIARVNLHGKAGAGPWRRRVARIARAP